MSEVSAVLGTGSAGALRIEENGINVITESERKGQPRELFWPWFGANVSVLGLSYGAYILGFGISFWQGLIVAILSLPEYADGAYVPKGLAWDGERFWTVGERRDGQGAAQLYRHRDEGAR